MLVRSVQRAVIHDMNLRQSGTGFFLVSKLVCQLWQSLSNSVLALTRRDEDVTKTPNRT